MNSKDVERDITSMKALVVYDSRYRNTEQIAKTIAEKLGWRYQVRLMAASEADDLDLQEIDLLVAGGPTQIRGISPALRTLLQEVLSGELRNVLAAAFDTRLRDAKLLTEQSSIGIAKKLKKKGARLLVPPESFLVTRREGPLVDGELERASTWAADVLKKAMVTVGNGED